MLLDLSFANSITNNVIGYICLQELAIATTNYNINTYNNKLVLVDEAVNTQTFTVQPDLSLFIYLKQG